MGRFDHVLTELGIAVTSERLESFVALFARWNSKINLSAARTEAELDDQVRDSLPVVPVLMGCHRVLDVGSGGGFPVVIAALCLSDTDFVSLEPVHKKHAFLRTAARDLRVPNLECHSDRLEDHRGSGYDAATSRATFDLVEWLEMGMTYVRPGGFVIGFEALPRTDLPAGTVRLPYSLEGKTRSLVRLDRPVPDGPPPPRG